jgi:hypothetical protein
VDTAVVVTVAILMHGNHQGTNIIVDCSSRHRFFSACDNIFILRFSFCSDHTGPTAEDPTLLIPAESLDAIRRTFRAIISYMGLALKADDQETVGVIVQWFRFLSSRSELLLHVFRQEILKPLEGYVFAWQHRQSPARPFYS